MQRLQNGEGDALGQTENGPVTKESSPAWSRSTISRIAAKGPSRRAAMRLLIYSDMSSAPWGGSEILWSKLVPRFKQRGATVGLTAYASERSRRVCSDSNLEHVFLLPRSEARPSQQAESKTLSKLSGQAIRRARQRAGSADRRRKRPARLAGGFCRPKRSITAHDRRCTTPGAVRRASFGTGTTRM